MIAVFGLLIQRFCQPEYWARHSIFHRAHLCFHFLNPPHHWLTSKSLIIVGSWNRHNFQRIWKSEYVNVLHNWRKNDCRGHCNLHSSKKQLQWLLRWAAFVKVNLRNHYSGGLIFFIHFHFSVSKNLINIDIDTTSGKKLLGVKDSRKRFSANISDSVIRRSIEVNIKIAYH